MKRLIALLALPIALAGCTTLQDANPFRPRTSAPPTTVTASSTVSSAPLGSTPTSYTPPATTATATAANVDEARALLEADRQLGIAAQDKGLGLAMAAVSDYQTVVLTPAGQFVGVDAINRGLATSANAGPLFWQPEKASVAHSNDFGTTSGAYVQVLRGAEAVQGKYLAVWRKDAGVWRVVSTAIMPNPPLPRATPARR